MELRALQTFSEVVRCGSFTAAATRLRLTQPSISRIIKQLEDEIGHVLITRNREISLTDAGKILYKRSLHVIREMAALDSDIAELSTGRRGMLSLGIPPLGGTLFVPLIKKFRDRYPGLDLHLYEKASKATERALASTEIEIGTLIMPVNERIYQFLELSQASLVLAAPSTSRWAGRDHVKLSELRDENFILFPTEFGLNDRIEESCRQVGFELKIVSRSGHAPLILGLVANGVGIALLPSSVVTKAPNVELIPVIDPVIDWNIALAWPRHAHLSTAARAMIDLAKEGTLDALKNS